jgi:hypothetical protein
MKKQIFYQFLQPIEHFHEIIASFFNSSNPDTDDSTSYANFEDVLAKHYPIKVDDRKQVPKIYRRGIVLTGGS